MKVSDPFARIGSQAFAGASTWATTFRPAWGLKSERGKAIGTCALVERRRLVWRRSLFRPVQNRTSLVLLGDRNCSRSKWDLTFGDDAVDFLLRGNKRRI